MIKKTSATNFWCNDDYDNKEIFLWEIDDVASIRDIRYLCCLSESFCTSGRYRVRDCCQSMWIDSASASCHFAHARSSFFLSIHHSRRLSLFHFSLETSCFTNSFTIDCFPQHCFQGLRLRLDILSSTVFLFRFFQLRLIAVDIPVSFWAHA